MLILSRRIGEKIMIEGGIEITVVDVYGGNKARLGIVAPRSLAVHREEVFEAIQAAKLDKEFDVGGES